MALALGAGLASAAPLGSTALQPDIRKAIAEELQALKDVRAGKFDDARQHLEESRRALERARAEAARNPDLGPATADLRQAITKDGLALQNLRPRPARDPALLINEAIVRKESAAEWVAAHVQPNRPPQIVKFVAAFPTGPNGTTTTYTVTATDPDPGTKLTYVWEKRHPPGAPCGTFSWAEKSRDSSVATWDHPHPPCPREPVHAADVLVTVSDGEFSCTVAYQLGSAPTPPEGYDPRTQCAVPALTPEQANALAARVADSISLEEKAAGAIRRGKPAAARGFLSQARRLLDRVRAGIDGKAGVDRIERAINEADALDGEARVDIKAGALPAALDKIRRAIAQKERAQGELKAKAKG